TQIRRLIVTPPASLIRVRLTHSDYMNRTLRTTHTTTISLHRADNTDRHAHILTTSESAHRTEPPGQKPDQPQNPTQLRPSVTPGLPTGGLGACGTQQRSPHRWD